jgi:hypothetical protein
VFRLPAGGAAGLVGEARFDDRQRIAQAHRYGCNPIVVLFNNQRWEMLRRSFPAPTTDGQLALRQTGRSGPDAGSAPSLRVNSAMR